MRAVASARFDHITRVVRRGHAHLVAHRPAVLWRPRRADRRHAPHPGRGKTLDRRRALPARTELLHVAARPRSAAARHLHRLAAPRDARRPGRWAAVRSARFHFDHGVVHRLRALATATDRGGTVPGAQGGGHRAGHRGDVAHRQTRADESQRPLGGGSRLLRYRGISRALPAHRVRCRPRRIPSCPLRLWVICSPARKGRGPGRAASGHRCWPSHPGATFREPRPQTTRAVAAAMVRARARLRLVAGNREHLYAARRVLQQDGRGHVWRRLRRAHLRRPAGGGTLRLGDAHADARRTRAWPSPRRDR